MSSGYQVYQGNLLKRTDEKAFLHKLLKNMLGKDISLASCVQAFFKNLIY